MNRQIKPNCICIKEDIPVVAQRSTQVVHNIVCLLAAFPTLLISLFFLRSGSEWHCPSCGGPVRDLAAEAHQAELNHLANLIPRPIRYIAIAAFLILVLILI